MKSIKTVLLIEDNPGDARLVRETLSEQGSHTTALVHVGCMSEAETYLAEHTVDVVLLDPGLPDAHGLGAVRRAHAAAPRVAEGVETQTGLAFLQAHHCDEAQGYYFSRPVLPQQLARLLESGIPEPVAVMQ